MSKLIGYRWFGGATTIGIVLCYDEIEKEFKSWIATVSGIGEKLDLEYIQQNGTKFPVYDAISLIEATGIIIISRDNFYSLTEETMVKEFNRRTGNDLEKIHDSVSED